MSNDLREMQSSLPSHIKIDVEAEYQTFSTWARYWLPHAPTPSPSSPLFDAWLERARRAFEASLARPQGGGEDLAAYDAGLLNDFGGGDVEWWQDYIRAELGRAHDFYVEQVSALRTPPADERGEALREARTPPDLLSRAEEADLLADAEILWRNLQANTLGGFSGRNRPFYILAEFKHVIEKYGHRDVGLTWSNDARAALATREGE